MEINRLKENAVDITPVEDSSQNNEESQEITPEEKEKQEKFLRGMIIRKHKWILNDLINRMKSTHYSIDQIKEEIQQKKCPLSALERNFISGFKTEFLIDLIKDMLTQKDLYEINLA